MSDLPRRQLLILLLRSYLDAQPGLHKAGEELGYISRGKKAGSSSVPLHSGESRQLWQQGSYPELERWLQRLWQEYPREYEAVHICYVHQTPRRPRNVDNHEKRKLRYLREADSGLTWLLERMPRYIRVPKSMVENSGHVVRPKITHSDA
jgi:hypothetical protein